MSGAGGVVAEGSVDGANGRGDREAKGRLISTGQAIVDLVLRIDAIPAPGGDTFARSHDLTAGGGFNAMAAATRDGAPVVYAGGHGTGRFGDAVRAAMSAERIEVLAPVMEGEDTGFSVALVDASAERTFISTRGAECRASIDGYRAAAPLAGDVVLVSGYSLLHAANREALVAWLPTLPGGVRVVVDPSPLVAEIDEAALRAVIGRCDVWSTNEREALLVAERFGVAVGEGRETLAAGLAEALGCDVVLRAGTAGAVLARAGADGADGARPGVVVIPALPVRAVDTNGAGDAHTGVLCAGLAAGLGLEAAARRAGVAAGVAVTREGPATSPTRAEIDAVLAGEGYRGA